MAHNEYKTSRAMHAHNSQGRYLLMVWCSDKAPPSQFRNHFFMGPTPGYDADGPAMQYTACDVLLLRLGSRIGMRGYEQVQPR